MHRARLAVALCLLLFARIGEAAEDPSALLERFFRAYGEGTDLAAFWAAEAPGRVDFERAARLTLRTRCIELHGVRVDDVVVEPQRATAHASLLLTKRERATPRAWGPAVIDYRVVLAREGDEWRIREVTPDAVAVAQELIAAPTAEARRQLLEQANMTPDLVRALLQSAIAATNVPNLEEARRIGGIAEDIAVQIGDQSGLSLYLSLRSIIARSEGPEGEAHALALQALELARRIDDPDMLARALISVGRALPQSSRAEGAALYREAESLEERVEDLSLMARAATALHLEAWSTNDFVAIRSELDQARKFSEMAGDATGTAAAMHGLAVLYDSLGQFRPCIEYASRAAELFEKISPGESYLASRFVEARCRYQNGEKDAAAALLERVLRLAREWNNEIQESFVLVESAEMRWHSGNLKDAERLARQALELSAKKQAGLRPYYRILAMILLEQKRYADALEETRLFRAWHEKTTAGDELSLRTIEARAHRGLGDLTAALADVNAAMEAAERARGHLPGDDEQLATAFDNLYLVQQAYQEGVALNVRLGRVRDAFRIAEQAKGRILLDTLSGAGRRSGKPITAEEEREERRLASDIASLNRRIAHARPGHDDVAALRAQLDRARSEYATLELSLSTRDPRLRAQRRAADIASLDEMAALLPEHGAFLEYVVGEERTYAFTLMRKATGAPDLRCRTIPIGRRALERKVTAYRERLAARNLTHRRFARELDALLLAPLDGLGARSVGIVPDGVLWQLPFETLVDGAGRYRLERHTMYYAPSISVLREMKRASQRRAPSRRPTLLAVGDPLIASAARRNLAAVYRSADLSPLPDARTEVEAIRRLYGVHGATVFVGRAATEARVKAEMGRYDVLHFATHGILDDASPMYSRLMLAEEEHAAGSDSDGMLEAWELMKLDLRADLVVLSTCDSASGRVSAGEGLIGMTWAAFVAGARTTVASVWPAASKSTAALMIDFHRELLAHPSGALAKAEALRRAKLRMLHDRARGHPFYWAPFLVIGDPGRQ